ncbi:LacI family DNA-binding transcriptional regulator [Rudaeicoccus suwonensis]|uniref:DNA-binding LacI/PurR family transcriptional regulator n=1 Tax=Rudaeicoccus suwonensis TaxID=657409 RepID=A0A561E0V3_9MICO|nr:LacI family DNA-binding transcriptional regulator [Rudaeicoccus suwonensis]TWE09265.1 DNA-binding LacI/PurR family transcriptional regulator [Rudaeicoccus suwonensis]
MSAEPTRSWSHPPAMTDVAQMAGVSAQTVSRVLREHQHVKAETRAKVMAAVEQLGYRRNNAARMLSSGRSNVIGLVLLQTGFYSRTAVTLGIEGAARDAGFAITTVTTPSLQTHDVEQAMSLLADQGVDGIILSLPLISVSPRIEELTRSIPTITTDGSRTAMTEVVAVDQVDAAQLATQHLIDLGHRTVWHVSGPAEWLDASSRLEGWRRTLQEAGITPPPEVAGDWSPQSGYRAGQMLGRIPDVTAIFVASDEMAFGVIRALHEMGRRIPDDISVIGVDNIALSEYCSPSLTTVAQPFAQMGRLAVDHLLNLMDDPSQVPAPSTVQPQLIVRASTGPGPGHAQHRRS